MRSKLSPRIFKQLSHCYYSTNESIGIYNNRSLNVCLFGHHQSGKTILCSTITKLLSKVNSTRHVPIDLLDSNAEEQKLGSTINLSFAPINTGNTKVTLIDSPGREDLVKVKIRGLTLADIGVLVISSDHSQLIETINNELSLAKHFNLKEVVLFLVDKTPVPVHSILSDEAKKLQIQNIFNENGYINNLIVSTKTINELIRYIDQYPLPQRDLKCPLFLKIVQSKIFSRNDAYILGYVEKGSLEAGQNLTVIGKGREFDVNIAKIVSSSMGNDKIEAGHLCELMVRGDRCKWLTKGMIITEPGVLQAYDNINCLIKPYPLTMEPNDLETINSHKLSLYSNQIASACFIENLTRSNQNIEKTNTIYLYKCNLKLSHLTIFFINQPIALSKDKKLIALGQVDQILTNLNAEDKLNLFLRLKK